MILFAGTGGVSFRSVVWPARLNCQALARVLFGVMPLFSFWGLWDRYLSAALYSGNTLDANLEVSDAVREMPPPEAQAHTRPGYQGWELDLFYWCYERRNRRSMDLLVTQGTAVDEGARGAATRAVAMLRRIDERPPRHGSPA